jgi:2-dehydropantoate 2-reductase
MLVSTRRSSISRCGMRFRQSLPAVTFLVRPRRAAQLQESGLQIVSPHRDVTVRPKLVTADGIEALYDAVLLAVKAYSLDAAIDDLATAVGPETTIMPVLNGMRHVDILGERFGKEAVAGGVCKVATTVHCGRIVQLATFQELAYGERDGSHRGWRHSTLSCEAPGSMLGCPVRSSTRCGKNGRCSPRWAGSPA